MSNNKRKRLARAYAYLREVNNGPFPVTSLSGWHLRNPTLRFVLRRGLAKLKRISWDYGSVRNKRTVLDTGVPWSRRHADRRRHEG